jgi:HNH endonuclease
MQIIDLEKFKSYMAFSESVKKNVKRKAHFMCCLCKSIDIEVHHIIPQEEKGPDSEDNAAPLCPSCHETYGGNPRKRKLIRDAKKLWLEICEKKYSTGAGVELGELLKLTKSINNNTNPQIVAENIITALSNNHLNINQKSKKTVSLSIGEILDILHKHKEPKTNSQIANFTTTYLLLFGTKSNLKSDREYNDLKKEFTYFFGYSFQKKITLHLIKSFKIDWINKGVTDFQIDKLAGACFMLMFCLLHHCDLKLKEFFVDANIDSYGQFNFSLKKGTPQKKMKKIYNKYNK